MHKPAEEVSSDRARQGV